VVSSSILHHRLWSVGMGSSDQHVHQNDKQLVAYQFSLAIISILSEQKPLKVRLTTPMSSGWQVKIYIYKSDCLYLCPSFTPEPPDQSPPNFAQTSPPTQGWFLARKHDRTNPTPGPQGTPNSKRRKLIKFFPGSAEAWLASKKYLLLTFQNSKFFILWILVFRVLLSFFTIIR